MTSQNLVADIDLTPRNGHYAPHSHPTDQLAWAQGGLMRVRVEALDWRVTQEQFVWIPAHAEHEVWTEGAHSLLSLYLSPDLRPAGGRWRDPMVLPVDDLAGAVMRHLCTRERPLAQRQGGFTLLRDLLESTPESADALTLPEHPESRVVAERLLEQPASDLSLEDWAAQLGVSSKTVLRGFIAGTGLTFAQWRTRSRLYRARHLLAEGWPVQDAAAEVGYATTTGFIKAYRRTYRVTPSVHAATRRRQS